MNDGVTYYVEIDYAFYVLIYFKVSHFKLNDTKNAEDSELIETAEALTNAISSSSNCCSI